MEYKNIIVTGMLFGDEGKGTAVDYLSSHKDTAMVVKYCGGHQCAHNVVLDNGDTHCFSQFGSGTFNGINTYLGPNFIVELKALEKEAARLEKLGINKPLSLISIDYECLITTPYHKILNQVKEISRKNKHGSCGIGIGETRRYWIKYGESALKFRDFFKSPLEKVRLLRDRILIDLQKYNKNKECLKLIDLAYSLDYYDYIKECRRIADCIHSDQLIKLNGNVIFEGSQGVLLDEYHGFHPHTTWSTTTSRHALELIKRFWLENKTETMGVLRTYMTRHGNGPFPTEQRKSLTKFELNQSGAFNGSMRYGYMDMNLVNYALQCQPVDSLFLTHTDEDPKQVCYEYMNIDGKKPRITCKPGNLKYQAKITRRLFRCLPKEYVEHTAYDALNQIVPIKYVSSGPKRKDKTEVIQK